MLSPGTFLRIARSAPVPLVDTDAAIADPPTRPTDADCVAFLRIAAGGVVVLQERRPDGTPGIELHVPPDEYTDEVGRQFVEKIRRKHARRLTLLR